MAQAELPGLVDRSRELPIRDDDGDVDPLPEKGRQIDRLGLDLAGVSGGDKVPATSRLTRNESLGSLGHDVVQPFQREGEARATVIVGRSQQAGQAVVAAAFRRPRRDRERSARRVEDHLGVEANAASKARIKLDPARVDPVMAEHRDQIAEGGGRLGKPDVADPDRASETPSAAQRPVGQPDHLGVGRRAPRADAARRRPG